MASSSRQFIDPLKLMTFSSSLSARCQHSGDMFVHVSVRRVVHNQSNESRRVTESRPFLYKHRKLWASKRRNFRNDGKIDPTGHTWCLQQPAERGTGVGNLLQVCAIPSGSVEAVAGWMLSLQRPSCRPARQGWQRPVHTRGWRWVCADDSLSVFIVTSWQKPVPVNNMRLWSLFDADFGNLVSTISTTTSTLSHQIDVQCQCYAYGSINRNAMLITDSDTDSDICYL